MHPMHVNLIHFFLFFFSFFFYFLLSSTNILFYFLLLLHFLSFLSVVCLGCSIVCFFLSSIKLSSLCGKVNLPALCVFSYNGNMTTLHDIHPTLANNPRATGEKG